VAIEDIISLLCTDFATGTVLATRTMIGVVGIKLPEYPPSTAASTNHCHVSIGALENDTLGFVTPPSVSYQFGDLHDMEWGWFNSAATMYARISITEPFTTGLKRHTKGNALVLLNIELLPALGRPPMFNRTTLPVAKTATLFEANMESALSWPIRGESSTLLV
jgi:hypothetical protein